MHQPLARRHRPQPILRVVSRALAPALLVCFGACAKDPVKPKPVPVDRPSGFVPNLPAAVAPGPLPATDVVFAIDTGQRMWTISPDIYGVNTPAPDASLDARMRAGNVRIGGNRLSAFNWENNASNAGTDYNNQNDGYLAATNAPGGLAEATLAQARSMGAGAVITVPIGDYVAADKLGRGDVAGASAGDAPLATGYLATRFKKNVAAKGAAFSEAPDPADDFVYEDEYAAWLKGHAQDTPIAIALDNEPELWPYKHPRIHFEKTTYAGLVERTTRYATAIKAVWPEVPMLGFVSYGWQGYVTLQNAPDANDNGQFWDYFLARMKAAEDVAGCRLLDYLDLHWYPEAKGGDTRIVTAGKPAAAADLAEWEEARLQAPRSLWDPTYTESSWIAGNLGGPIALIPRARQKIAANYPGTKLAFTEWNYGGSNDITGGIATADVLGIFGREGVALANIWWLEKTEPYTVAGLKVFRNFDGKQGEFGDIGVAAGNGDTVNTSVYASLSSDSPGHVVVVAINKQKDATLNAGITLAHPATFAKAKTFVLTAASFSLKAGGELAAIGTNAFVYAMPPRSVSVLVFDGELGAAAWSPGTTTVAPPGTPGLYLDAGVKPDADLTPADARGAVDAGTASDGLMSLDVGLSVD
jgi:hypothetical protein